MTAIERPHRHARSALSRRVLAVVLVVVAVAWLPLNHDVEGPILFALDATHGVTTADLLSVALFLVARSLFLAGVGPRGRHHRARNARAALARA